MKLLWTILYWITVILVAGATIESLLLWKACGTLIPDLALIYFPNFALTYGVGSAIVVGIVAYLIRRATAIPSSHPAAKIALPLAIIALILVALGIALPSGGPCNAP